MLLPERDLTRAGTKCREGCASDIKIRTAPQRQRSDTHKVPRLRDRCYNSHCATARAIRYTHKVPRRLRELYQNSHRATTRAIRHAQGQERVARAHLGYSQNMARTTKKEHYKCFTEVSATFLSRSTKYCACHENEPGASEVPHLPHGIIIMSKIKNE